MNDILIIKIIFICASIGWVYVEKLTENYGLLDFLPKYYPAKLETLLNCSFCISGWLSIGAVVINYDELKDIFLYALIFTPFCTMAAVKILFYK